MDIPLPQPAVEDIYSYGFDKGLNKIKTIDDGNSDFMKESSANNLFSGIVGGWNVKASSLAADVASFPNIAAGKTTFTNVRLLGDTTSEFTITNIEANVFRYTWNGNGTDPLISKYIALSDTIFYHSTIGNSDNNGVFTVIAIGTNYFEVSNATPGVAEANKALGRGKLEVSRDGFILGVDASDELSKFFIGNYNKHMYWNGSSLYLKGSLESADVSWITFFGGELMDNGGVGAETITFGSDGVTLQTGADANNTAYVRKNLSNYTGTVLTWNKNRRIRFGLKMTQKTNQTIYLISGDVTANKRKIGFKIVNEDLYGVIANGTTENSCKLIDTLDETLYYVFEARYYYNDRVEFYANNNFIGLLGTVADLPSGTIDSEYLLYAYIKTDAATNKIMDIAFWDFWQEY